MGTVQEVIVGQFGPVKTIIAVEGSKLPPLTVSENEPVVTVVGDMLLIDGVISGAAEVELARTIKHRVASRSSLEEDPNICC